ncbi:MAG: ribonuclease H [Haloferacaceae archaeon]
MAVPGRSTLRNLFDDSPTPHIAHPPRTHRRQFYVATDGSYRSDGGGLGAVIEARDGRRVARVAVPDAAPDNNVAEYRALHLGLDVLAARAPASSRVGVLVDLDDLAANVNRAALADDATDWAPGGEIAVPTGSEHHWRGIRARIAGFGEVRAATVDGRENPAHPLANAPAEFAHVNRKPARCVRPHASDGPLDRPAEGDEREVPPPSRAERRAGD